MDIRKLTADEAEIFRAIRVEMVSEHPEAFGHTPEEVRHMPDYELRKLIDPRDIFPEQFVLGAFDGDRLVGTVGFVRDEHEKRRHRALIWTVYVKEYYRGMGLSRALMQTLINEARRIAGLEILYLSVATTQRAARRLYETLGFTRWGIDERCYKVGDHYADHEELVLRL